jgi:hypothetical protein
MPLQIRRGTEAERIAMVPKLANGELLWITDAKKLYIGDGTLASSALVPVTGFSTEDAQDAAALLFTTTPTHSGISFTYDDFAGKLTATVNLADYNGTIKASSFNGTLVANDSSTLVNAETGEFYGDLIGNVVGNVVGNVLGNVTGNLTGNVVGNLTGNVVATTLSGSLTGNTTGYHTGDVTGSVFPDASSLGGRALVDAIDNTLNTAGLSIVNSNIVGTASSSYAINIGTEAIPGVVRLNIDSNLEIKQTVSAGTGRYVTYIQNRGTLSSPTAVQAGDILGGMLMKGYTNTSSSGIVGNLVFVVDPTASVTSGSGFIKGQLVLSCASDTAIDTSKSAGLDSTGAFQVHHLTATNWIENAVYADDAARSAAIPTPVKGAMVFMSAGTSPSVTNKLVVYDGGAWVALH